MKNKSIDATVMAMIDDVKENGDAALIRYTQQYDKVRSPVIKVPSACLTEDFKSIPEGFKKTISEAIENIRTYHGFQVPKDFEWSPEPGIRMGQRIVPLQRVAIYIPGGTATYPSTVLMNAIPAQIAGVDEIVVLTPPGKNGKINNLVHYVCEVLGIREIYAIGGAQAIAAAAYGTETIKRVDKIVGPGNIFVATAKKHVFGDVAIDMIAGPSEIAIIADATASPDFIAADLLAQAEHDTDARLFLITTESTLVDAVATALQDQLGYLTRADIARQALKNNYTVIRAPSINDAIATANQIAPEHLELAVHNPFDYLSQIKNAGAVFLGQYTPEALGDYYAGTNHTLPTQGTARFSSPLGVYDFIKRPSYLYYSQSALQTVSERIEAFAALEGLTAHQKSMEVRRNAR